MLHVTEFFHIAFDQSLELSSVMIANMQDIEWLTKRIAPSPGSPGG
jgi:hypothetical protein